MTSTVKRTERSIEEVVANAKAGIFDCRLDDMVPPELFGPPTEAELRAEAAERRRTNGRGRHTKPEKSDAAGEALRQGT